MSGKLLIYFKIQKGTCKHLMCKKNKNHGETGEVAELTKNLRLCHLCFSPLREVFLTCDFRGANALLLTSYDKSFCSH